MTPTQPDESAWTVEISRSALERNNREMDGTAPLLRGGLESTNEESIEVPIPLTGGEHSESIHVLHVDDNPDLAELTQRYLEQHEGFTVTCRTNAVEALAFLRERDVDCVISDYEMPNTDGIEFLEIVREKHPNLPFILFTAKGSEAIASEAIAAGATDYMQKDVGSDHYEVLANRVRNAVERYRTQQRFWNALSWYQHLVEQDLTGVFIVQDAEFIYVNRQLADILGYSQSELVGTPPTVVASTTEDEAVLQEVMAANAGADETFEYDLSVTRRDGVDVPVEIHGGAIQHDGAPGCIGLLWDRSDRD